MGTFVWELLLCAFMAWVMLGAVNETTPMAFSFISAEWTAEHVSLMMSSALALGNVVGILVGGWLADQYGRLAVIRPALLTTICCGSALQAAKGFYQSAAARLALGLVSGSLLGVLPPLVAELLPARHRGFYLTIWCAGWPAGALYAMLTGCMLPSVAWRTFYTLMLIPAVILYVCMRADMMLESPRYLYLKERREEGFEALLDMYEKERVLMPWSADSIAVTCAPWPSADGGFGGGSCSRGCRRRSTSRPMVMTWLAFTFFMVSGAAQSFKLWMPLMLVADATDAPTVDAQRGAFGLAALQTLPHAPRFAEGPGALSLLSTASAPLMTHEPNYIVIFVLAQAYMAQLVGVVVCAYMSSWMHRRQMVTWSIPIAAGFGLLALAVAESRSILFCGPVLGAQLAAQAASLNFLQAFACEYFPTVRRAQAVAVANFAAQLGNLAVPMAGGLLVRRVSPAGAAASSRCTTWTGEARLEALGTRPSGRTTRRCEPRAPARLGDGLRCVRRSPLVTA